MQKTPGSTEAQAMNSLGAREKLAVTYIGLFTTLGDPAQAARFTARERASCKGVKKAAAIDIGDDFELQFAMYQEANGGKSVGFKFTAPISDIKDNPSLTLACAHELKHASLVYNALRPGLAHTNIHTLIWIADTPNTLAAAHFNAGAKELTALVDEANATPLARVTRGLSCLYHSFAGGAWTMVSLLSDPVYYALRQGEEYLCDAFALRAVPDANLEKFHDFLCYKRGLTQKNTAPSKKEPDSFLEMLYDTHPSPASRYHRLKKMQQALQTHGQ